MDKKEYIEREALKRDLIDNRNFYPAIVKCAIEKAPAADADGVDEILKKHRAFVMATIDGHGCHIGTYKKISLEADGDWIIDVDVESLSVTGQGDFAPVVHGEWKQARYTEASLYICSECDKPEYKQHKYCPNCGAKMDGGKK